MKVPRGNEWMLNLVAAGLLFASVQTVCRPSCLPCAMSVKPQHTPSLLVIVSGVLRFAQTSSSRRLHGSVDLLMAELCSEINKAWCFSIQLIFSSFSPLPFLVITALFSATKKPSLTA